MGWKFRGSHLSFEPSDVSMSNRAIWAIGLSGQSGYLDNHVIWAMGLIERPVISASGQ